VHELTKAGHRVYVEAGEGAALPDEEYTVAGAKVADSGSRQTDPDLIANVFGPLPEEYTYLREG
jgi:alanine dehydrogenase